MAVKRIGADTLLELALATLRDEIGPALPSHSHEAAAMVARAIEIARREIARDVEAPLWPLLDQLYEPGEGNVKQLAVDIRTGEVSEAKTPGLGQHLLALLEAELAVANPRFLGKGG